MDALSHKSVNKQSLDEWLDSALEQSFPASDPIPSFRGEPQVKSVKDVDSTSGEAGHGQHGRSESGSDRAME